MPHERSRKQCSLTISVSKADGDEKGNGAARVLVQDTGIGIPQLFGQAAVSHERHDFFGIGLSNVYDRLHQLYQQDDLLGYVSNPEDGTSVSLTIPAERPTPT